MQHQICGKSLHAVFLGARAATLTEPLSANYVYRKHPEHGVFYLNWAPDSLQDGDVLLVKNHEEFFLVANQARALSQFHARPCHFCLQELHSVHGKLRMRHVCVSLAMPA